jgi:exopolyphosphatase/guanosine-5'-triphosphate,3'-diphosphate pyrophosphatase
MQVSELKAMGTAALRTASNGADFVKQVKSEMGIDIELIDGSREAELIHKGVIQAVPFEAKNYMIMDIGGGSVEFIIANVKEVLWAQSFPVGAAVLLKKFHQEDPISIKQRTLLKEYLEEIVTPMFPVLQKYPVDTLVGASGTFDILEDALTRHKPHPLYGIIPMESYQAFFEKVIPISLAERSAMTEVPDNRADMIVVALLLLDFAVQKANIQSIIASAYAMKEGMLAEMIG